MLSCLLTGLFYIIQLFNAGISNVLYGYYEDGKFHEDVVLFRIHGEGTELMIDRKREREYIQASITTIFFYIFIKLYTNKCQNALHVMCYVSEMEEISVRNVNEQNQNYSPNVSGKQFFTQSDQKFHWPHLE